MLSKGDFPQVFLDWWEQCSPYAPYCCEYDWLRVMKDVLLLDELPDNTFTSIEEDFFFEQDAHDYHRVLLEHPCSGKYFSVVGYDPDGPNWDAIRIEEVFLVRTTVYMEGPDIGVLEVEKERDSLT